MRKIIEGKTMKVTRHLCLPDNATPEQMIRVLVKCLEQNQAKLNELGWLCVFEAQVEVFPCTAD